jgi:hypothetical protein
MKRIILVLLLLPFLSFAQDTIGIARLPVDPSTKLITYTKTLKNEALKKDVMFSKVKEWLIYSYSGQGSPIQFDEFSTGRILAMGQKSKIMVIKTGLAGNMPTPALISYVLKFTISDGECKLVMDRFSNSYNGNSLAVEQAFEMFKSIKRNKQTVKMANDIADMINEVATSTILELTKTLN